MLAGHDALRAVFDPVARTFDVRAADVVDPAALVRRVDVRGLDERARSSVLSEETDVACAALDPEAGAMMRLVFFDTGPDRPGRVLVVIHHLVVDGVSWRILVPDLAAACEGVEPDGGGNTAAGMGAGTAGAGPRAARRTGVVAPRPRTRRVRANRRAGRGPGA